MERRWFYPNFERIVIITFTFVDSKKQICMVRRRTEEDIFRYFQSAQGRYHGLIKLNFKHHDRYGSRSPFDTNPILILYR
jgi:hypothetical protein